MGKTIAMVGGWIVVLLGVLGFFPNPIVGEGATFHADMMHNVIHIILGALLLWTVYSRPAKMAMMLKTVGGIFLALAVLGFVLVSGTGSLLGLAEVNSADHVLHLVLGVVFLWAGMQAGKRSMSATM
ncbi:MAG: DUF4383 domain-containing protein [Parcubacteria group bacterium]